MSKRKNGVDTPKKPQVDQVERVTTGPMQVPVNTEPSKTLENGCVNVLDRIYGPYAMPAEKKRTYTKHDMANIVITITPNVLAGIMFQGEEIAKHILKFMYVLTEDEQYVKALSQLKSNTPISIPKKNVSFKSGMLLRATNSIMERTGRDDSIRYLSVDHIGGFIELVSCLSTITTDMVVGLEQYAELQETYRDAIVKALGRRIKSADYMLPVDNTKDQYIDDGKPKTYTLDL